MALQSGKLTVDTEFSSDGTNNVTGHFKLRQTNRSDIDYNEMSWTLPNGQYLMMPYANKGFKKKFNLQKGEDIVLVKFGDYGKFISIADETDTKINIEFYPEGGWLIEDVPCKVAFKATDKNGKGTDASGIIRDENGEKIAEFNTIHNGMGCVTFIPEPGKIYTAEYNGSDLKKHTVDIGSAKKGTPVLRYNSVGSKSTFSVAGENGKTYELVVASRGSGFLAAPISTNMPLTIDKSELPAGVYQALLVSPSDSVVLSERMFFIGVERSVSEVGKLSSDSTTLLLNTSFGNSADCSVRITNENIVPGVNENDIRSQLLLQSELRGRIENPKYYFKDVNRETEQNLDLLMMVNGWSRYNLPDAILGRYTEPEIPLEIGQEITGQVRSRWKNNPLEGIMVYAISPKNNFGMYANTNENGEFHLNGFDFPENTTFIFKAMNQKGDNETNYEIYEDHYPSIDIVKSSIELNSNDISAYLTGNQWKILDEITVNGMSESEVDKIGLDMYNSISSYKCDANDIAARGISSIDDALRGLPGISTQMGYLKWRNNYIAYYLDGRIFEPASNVTGGFGAGPTLTEIEGLIPFESIERIDFIRPEYSLMIGRNYGGGVVMISTKTGNKTNWQRQFELKDYLPLGYQKYKEYASPMLSVDADEYDMQTQPTLLWIPSVKFDNNGTAIDLKFPVNSNHRVIIEGVTDKGDIISETL